MDKHNSWVKILNKYMCQIWTNTTFGFKILFKKCVKYRYTQMLGLIFLFKKKCVKYQQTQPLGLKFTFKN